MTALINILYYVVIEALKLIMAQTHVYHIITGKSEETTITQGFTATCTKFGSFLISVISVDPSVNKSWPVWLLLTLVFKWQGEFQGSRFLYLSLYLHTTNLLHSKRAKVLHKLHRLCFSQSENNFHNICCISWRETLFHSGAYLVPDPWENLSRALMTMIEPNFQRFSNLVCRQTLPRKSICDGYKGFFMWGRRDASVQD